MADITYLPTVQRCMHLSPVTGVYSRRIVDHYMHDSLHAESVTQALRMALKTRHTRQSLVHHSDRGIQYCPAEYQCIHQRHGITCPMTDGYNCYQNTLAEQINDTPKGELLLKRPTNLEQAARMMARVVHIYNHGRSHLALKYKTSNAVYQVLVDWALRQPMAGLDTVVKQVEKGELTYRETQRHYGIQGCSTVLVWLREHRRQDWSALVEAKTTTGNQNS